MDDASTKPRAKIAVTRGFECSRLESELLAVAYEHAVPILSRPISCRSEVYLGADDLLATSASEMEIEGHFAMGGLVG
jgi:hypothetical protein